MERDARTTCRNYGKGVLLTFIKKKQDKNLNLYTVSHIKL